MILPPTQEVSPQNSYDKENDVEKEKNKEYVILPFHKTFLRWLDVTGSFADAALVERLRDYKKRIRTREIQNSYGKAVS